MLKFAAAAGLACVQAQSSYSISDAPGLGPRFDGIGAISGGGATSRLLPEYDNATLSNILDYLFTPNFGASLHMFKVEIGGEALATEGSEATHMRTPDDQNYNRGYEWMLMREAKARNPSILLYGLPWTWPGWVGDAAGRDPWKVNVSLPAQYVTNWIAGAKSEHGLDIDIIGVWNERPYSSDYVKTLRQMLDASGFGNTGILCDDAKYACVPDILKDPELAAAVAYVGGHDPANAQAASTGKPLWFSEDFHAKGGEAGAGTWASQINRRYIQYNMTATLAWNAIDSFYQGLSFDNTGLMNARSPWSGGYEVLGTIWATAHTTQFTQPGWSHLKVSAQGGAGMLSEGGSYTTYEATDGSGDFTIVVEKFSNEGDRRTNKEDAQFCLGGSLATGKASQRPLQVWMSTFAIQPGEQSVWFEKQSTVTPDPTTMCFTLTIPVDSLWTITTLTTGGKGDHGPPPPDAPFPFPFADNYDACVPPAQGRYWSDISGSWECVPDASNATNVVMRQVTPAKPISWESDFRPHSVLGSMNWSNVNFTTSLRLNDAADIAVVGVRCSLLNQTDYAALMSEIPFPGLWLGINATGWTVWPSIATVGNFSRGAGIIASGTAANGPIQPGSWHTVSLVSTDDSLSASMDNAPLFSGVDVSRYPYTGWVGVGTGDYGHFVDFDNVMITAPAPAS